MKIALPVVDNKLCNHFGHCDKFAILDIQDNKIANKTLVIPPPHEPGVLPGWLGEMGVEVVIAGGMGQRALALLTKRGVKVITGAPGLSSEELVEQYLKNTLVSGSNV
ncbi:MAG: NifB/NifX family molybdenum-iron cluster-binding protein [Pseudomonadota bacterium]